MDEGQRKCHFKLSNVVEHHKINLNKLYALLELVGACYWVGVGGFWLCEMFNVEIVAC